jgi:hypothetical protein
MNKPIRIDFEKGVLKTPNYKYHMKDTLTIDRYIEFEILQPFAAYGLSFTDIYAQDEQVLLHFNKGNNAEAISIIVNRRQSMKNMTVPTNSVGLKIDKRRHPILQIAALLFVREGEDVRTFDQSINDEKVQDFLDSGVYYEELFMLVVKLVPGLLAASAEVSRIILPMEELVESLQGLKESTSDKEK